MRIASKFPGYCARCKAQFAAGTEINWVSGQKPQHWNLAECVIQQPKPQIAIEDAGVYIMPDGSVVKVKANREKSRTYAMRWHEINPERSLEAGGRVQGDYEFVAGLVQEVAQNGRKMTLDEAKAFMVKYGQCCRCSRKLVAAQSVEQGIGPICIQYFGGK